MKAVVEAPKRAGRSSPYPLAKGASQEEAEAEATEHRVARIGPGRTAAIASARLTTSRPAAPSNGRIIRTGGLGAGG